MNYIKFLRIGGLILIERIVHSRKTQRIKLYTHIYSELWIIYTWKRVIHSFQHKSWNGNKLRNLLKDECSNGYACDISVCTTTTTACAHSLLIAQDRQSVPSLAIPRPEARHPIRVARLPSTYACTFSHCCWLDGILYEREIENELKFILPPTSQQILMRHFSDELSAMSSFSLESPSFFLFSSVYIVLPFSWIYLFICFVFFRFCGSAQPQCSRLSIRFRCI